MTTKDVTESTTDAMAKEEGRAKATPDAEAKTPGSASTVSPEKGPPIYTQEQSDALVRAASKEAAAHEAGRESKKTEATIASLNDQITDITAEREKIQAEIEELTKDDPGQFDLVKKDKDLRERERQLKTERTALDSEKQVHGEAIKLAQDTLLEISIWEIATEYDSGDPVKLKDNIAEFEEKFKIKISDEEGIRTIADSIWAKKAKEPEKKEPGDASLKTFSGKTDGGKGEKTEQQKLNERYPNTVF